MSTIAERQAKARERVCPRCHAEAGEMCKSQGGTRSLGRRTPRKHIQSVHPERMALLPFELTWHRAKGDGGGTVYRAVDNRTSPHTVYEVGRDEASSRYGFDWYLACWHDGVALTTQRKTGLSNQATSKRLASSSRCHECSRFVMFGDLVPQKPGSELFWCRDRESCQAIVAEKEARELEELRRIETEPYEAIELREGRFTPELVFTRAGMGGRSSNVVRATPADIDRLIEVLTAWKSANPPFDVDLSVSSEGPAWEWSREG